MVQVRLFRKCCSQKGSLYIHDSLPEKETSSVHSCLNTNDQGVSFMRVSTNVIKICIRFVTQTQRNCQPWYKNLLLYLKGWRVHSPPAAPTCCLKLWAANQKIRRAKGVKQPISDRMNWEQASSSLYGFIILSSLMLSYSVWRKKKENNQQKQSTFKRDEFTEVYFQMGFVTYKKTSDLTLTDNTAGWNRPE